MRRMTMDKIVDTIMGRDGDDDEQQSRMRNEPVQSDPVVEDPGIFPPDIDANLKVGGSPEEQGVLRDENSL
jgi:hypothetical protein